MKPMKAMKKIWAVMLSLVMAMVMVVPAFAAETKYTITAPSNDHTYEVYQIFTGDYSSSGTDDNVKVTLSNVKWGKNGTGTEGEAVSAEIITELTGTTGTDTAKLEVISKYVNLESDEFGTVTNGTPLQVPGGYYLIKDVDGALDGDENESYTLYVVEVVGDVTISPKAAVPEFNKKVQDINDTTDTDVSDWQDSADWDIGDKVPFKLTGTVASNYDNYKAYQFIFHDMESDGLTFDEESVVVKVDGEVISTGYEIVTEGLEDGCTFEVRFDDLKDIESVHAGSVITVEYESELNSNAVIGSQGNPNTAHLEFSNNPNDEQGGETGETPDDTVIVFTYKTIINKVDGEEKPLTGAAFKLEKKQEDGSYELVKEFTVEDDKTSFEFTGLDDGTYKLTETVTPSGYNTIDPIAFTITAEHDILSDNPTLTSLNGNATTGEIEFTSSTSEGSLSADVVNQSGATLPETGGMGTTIFYLLGGILVVGAGILLITRRRMSMMEDK